MAHNTEKEQRFLAVTDKYKHVIAKVCMLYVSPKASFEDLYQETLLNLWQGLDSFRGDAKISTWLYRTAINTCITWHRRSGRHAPGTAVSLENLIIEPADDNEGREMLERCKELYAMISRLGDLEKALISLWLDEKPYDEIAAITGISPGNVAVRIHRIKEKLSKMAQQDKI